MSTRRVRGFKIGDHGPKIIKIPFNASFLKVTKRRMFIVAWYLCDDTEKSEKHRFVLFNNNEVIDELYLQYKDTVYTESGYTHVFFDPRPEGDWNVES